jgi:hypothetical protein
MRELAGARVTCLSAKFSIIWSQYVSWPANRHSMFVYEYSPEEDFEGTAVHLMLELLTGMYR